jgi:type I restriction enzyme S subunit
MGEWKECKLAEAPLEILDGDRGKNYPSQDEFKASGYCLFLSTKNVRIDGFDFSECQFISKERDELLRKGKLENDDLVLTTRGTVGNIGFFDDSVNFGNVRINSGMVIIRPNKSKLLPSFNYYLFRKLQNDFHTFISGSAQPQLPIRDLKEVDVLIPPLPEQKAIASVLSSLDDKIDLLHRQNKTLEALAETLFRQWFVEQAQEDWEDACLEGHADACRGLSYKGSGLTAPGLGLPMHNLNSVYEGGGYKEAGIKFYSGDYKERHLVKSGDLIVANTEQGHEFRLIGYPAIIPKSFGDIGLFSQHLYRLAPKAKSYVTTEYLYYLLMTPFVREQVTAATNGSTVNMLAIDGLQRPEFKLPPEEKIKEFTLQIRLWWKRKECNQSQIRTLEKLRDTLLPKLMNGEVRVEI